MSDAVADGLFVRRGFLPPAAMLRLLAAFERLAPSWAPSQAMRLLGRGQTSQVRPTDLIAQGPLDEIRQALAPAVLQWARACGFQIPAAPTLQLFPVRMLGDTVTPAYQEPHTDSYGDNPAFPICSNVFYAKATAIEGGDLAVAPHGGEDLVGARLVRPAANTIVSFPGERVHAVQPLYAGERLSVVINFY
jgi:2OG-Fe(II) oxygenase superfamily